MLDEQDSVDDKIIKILQEDSRKSFVEIANEIGYSESAVRRRVKNLTRNGIIKKFTIATQSGDKTSAIALISVSSTSDTSAVSANLMKLTGVQTIYEITGQYDIAAIISSPSIAEINRCIDDVRRTDGVADTNTVIILRTIR
ncbi:MAG: Lrp/AsnC family transcriptional regulator [Nitrososphaeraceae archaeon]|jgi:Lrp/AsnC family transcriptional regulator, involved in the regulation of lysine biosynthesis